MKSLKKNTNRFVKHDMKILTGPQDNDIDIIYFQMRQLQVVRWTI